MSLGNDYRIKIFNGTVADASDANFSLVSPITVTSPNGGESWLPGTMHQVTWAPTSLSGGVTIELWKNGSLVGSLGSASASSGTTNWVIPADLALGTDYKIKVYQGPIADFSDANFTIASPLNVTSPNGGENWGLGLMYPITWTQFGMSGGVTIELWKNGALFQPISITDITTGEYNWTIPGLPVGADYQIKIYQGSVGDFSDAYFSLVVPSTYTISGHAVMAGAILSYTDGTLKTATADGSGNYSFTVIQNWSVRNPDPGRLHLQPG